jgi:hypothetical protein
MADPVFRLVCRPAALADTPAAWAREMLGEGEIALLGGDGGLAEINGLAHHLGLVSLTVLRGETAPEAQAETVISFAAALPLVWVGPAFAARAETWAHARGPMTLLVAAAGALGDAERPRIERFVAALGRQSE